MEAFCSVKTPPDATGIRIATLSNILVTSQHAELRVPTQYEKVWNLVLVITRFGYALKKREYINVILWFQFCFRKYFISKNKFIKQAECFSWHLEQAGSADKMFTTVSESACQSELDVESKAGSIACD